MFGLQARIVIEPVVAAAVAVAADVAVAVADTVAIAVAAAVAVAVAAIVAVAVAAVVAVVVVCHSTNTQNTNKTSQQQNKKTAQCSRHGGGLAVGSWIYIYIYIYIWQKKKTPNKGRSLKWKKLLHPLQSYAFLEIVSFSASAEAPRKLSRKLF